MKTMHKMALIAAMAFGTASTIQAQPAAGEWEITLGGGGIADRDFHNGGFNVDGSLGYYFTDNWELSLRQDMGYTNPDVGGTLWSGSSRIAGDTSYWGSLFRTSAEILVCPMARIVQPLARPGRKRELNTTF